MIHLVVDVEKSLTYDLFLKLQPKTTLLKFNLLQINHNTNNLNIS
jgi:hypothetical protein